MLAACLLFLYVALVATSVTLMDSRQTYLLQVGLVTHDAAARKEKNKHSLHKSYNPATRLDRLLLVTPIGFLVINIAAAAVAGVAASSVTACCLDGCFA
jgi:predicted ATPase